MIDLQNDGYIDAEGFSDLECRKCGSNLVTIQTHTDDDILRIICITCYEVLDVEYSEITNKGEDDAE